MSTMKAERSPAKRVPIPLSGEEIDNLQRLARLDQRSEAQMARIIYLAGVEHFLNATKKRTR